MKATRPFTLLLMTLASPQVTPAGGLLPTASDAGSIVCSAEGTAVELPPEVRESSGLAVSLLSPGTFWTHNDRGNGPELFAVDGSGRLLQRVIVAAVATDWEDIETGPCEEGNCIYIGDIGDNDAERSVITIYRLQEPQADDTRIDAVVALHARYPDGPRDAESLFVRPNGDLYVITKGRREEIALYRYPAPQRPDVIVQLERVRVLFPEPDDSDDRVTAATSTRDGRRIAVRTLRSLYFFMADDLMAGKALRPEMISLAALKEPQGEGLAIADGETVWLASEADGRDEPPMLNRLRCSFPI
ncbi:MAG: hypothetical protein WD078_06855 [Woeseia sp.]